MTSVQKKAQDVEFDLEDVGKSNFFIDIYHSEEIPLSLFHNFQNEFEKQMPLTIPWKPQVSKTLQNIKEITDIRLKLRICKQGQTSSPLIEISPIHWYLKSPLHLFILHSDDPKSYQENTYKPLSDWIKDCQLKNCNWFILHLSTLPDPSNDVLYNALSLSKLKKPVLERIRSDFNPKGDRTAQIRFVKDKPKETNWEEFLTKAKDLVGSYISNLIDSYEEEGRKVVAKRMEKGWNFCHYFLLKEGLAFMLKKINLLSECLNRYVELECIFLEEDQTKRLDYFVILEEGDDSPDILDLGRKKFRSQIYANMITEFDFRQYLFARKIEILFHLNHLSDICKETLKFLRSMGREIHANKTLFSDAFANSWIFSVSRSVIAKVEAVYFDEKNPPPDIPYLLSDLYYLARTKVDVLGKKAKFVTPRNFQKIESYCNIVTQKQQNVSPTRIGPPETEIQSEQRGTIKELSEIYWGNISEKYANQVLKARGQCCLLLRSGYLNEEKYYVSVWHNEENRIFHFPLALDQENAFFPANQLPEQFRGDSKIYASVLELMQQSPLFDRMILLKPKITTNRSLTKALSDVELFDALYKDLTNMSLTFYESQDRMRHNHRLKVDLGLLHFSRGRYLEASELFEQVFSSYKGTWEFLAYFIKTQHLTCLAHLELPLEYLRALIEFVCIGAFGFEISSQQISFYQEEFQKVSHLLKKNESLDISSYLVAQVQPQFESAMTDTEIEVSVSLVESVLKYPLPLEKILVIFENEKAETIVLSKEEKDIQIPAQGALQTFKLTQKATSKGKFTLKTIQLCSGSLTLEPKIETPQKGFKVLARKSSIMTPSRDEILLTQLRAAAKRPTEAFSVQNLPLFPNAEFIFIQIFVKSLLNAPLRISNYRLASQVLPTKPLLEETFVIEPHGSICLVFEAQANDQVFSISLSDESTQLLTRNTDSPKLFRNDHKLEEANSSSENEKHAPNFSFLFDWQIEHPYFEGRTLNFESSESVLLPRNRVNITLSECPEQKRVGDFFKLVYSIRLDTSTEKPITISFKLNPYQFQDHWSLHGRRVLENTLHKKHEQWDIPVQLLAVQPGLISVPIPEVSGLGVEVAVSSHSIHKQIRVFPSNELMTTWSKDISFSPKPAQNVFSN